MFFDIEYDDSMCGTNQVHFNFHVHHSHKAHDNGTVPTYHEGTIRKPIKGPLWTLYTLHYI